jgi:hypothetical protein
MERVCLCHVESPHRTNRVQPLTFGLNACQATFLSFQLLVACATTLSLHLSHSLMCPAGFVSRCVYVPGFVGQSGQSFRQCQAVLSSLFRHFAAIFVDLQPNSRVLCPHIKEYERNVVNHFSNSIFEARLPTKVFIFCTTAALNWVEVEFSRISVVVTSTGLIVTPTTVPSISAEAA